MRNRCSWKCICICIRISNCISVCECECKCICKCIRAATFCWFSFVRCFMALFIMQDAQIVSPTYPKVSVSLSLCLYVGVPLAISQPIMLVIVCQCHCTIARAARRSISDSMPDAPVFIIDQYTSAGDIVWAAIITLCCCCCCCCCYCWGYASMSTLINARTKTAANQSLANAPDSSRKQAASGQPNTLVCSTLAIPCTHWMRKWGMPH